MPSCRPPQRPLLSAWVSPAASKTAVSGGGTGRQPPPTEGAEPQETTGDNSATGLYRALAGQGREGTPPNRNDNPQHHPSPGERRRRPSPSPKSPEPLPSAASLGPPLPRPGPHHLPAPVAAPAPPPEPARTRKGRGRPGTCARAPSALHSPPRATPHDLPGHQVRAGGEGKQGTGSQGRGSGLKGPWPPGLCRCLAEAVLRGGA